MATILLFEDDGPTRSMIVRILGGAGHHVLEASDGRALTAALEAKRPAVVVTDLNMPEMDGLEVIMTTRRLAPDVPVIAISGGGQIPAGVLLRNASHLGAIHVLYKPFSVDELTSAIEMALGTRSNS